MRRKVSGDTSNKSAGIVIEDDGFVARRSTHVSGSATADGDTWQETLAVCELAGKLIIRSYFSNRRTKERQWDEPPSGASHVVHASETMRNMAEVQLQEMQVATGFVPDSDLSTPTSKRTGLGGLFRRAKGDKTTPTTTENSSSAEGRIQYKSGGFMGRVKRGYKHSQANDELDPAMQMALASSLSCQIHSAEVDELERAMALSLVDAGTSTEKAVPNDTHYPDMRREGLELDQGIKDVRPHSSSRAQSASKQRHSSSRERHAGKSGYNYVDEVPIPLRSTTNDIQRHRSTPRHRPQHRQELQPTTSYWPQSNNGRPDPLSSIDSYNDSIIRYEVSRDDEEALAIALSLSLMDAPSSKTTLGVASMPQVSDLSEEEQLEKAMVESMAVAPPELKSRQQCSVAEPLPCDARDWDDRKLPARGGPSTSSKVPSVDHRTSDTMDWQDRKLPARGVPYLSTTAPSAERLNSGSIDWDDRKMPATPESLICDSIGWDDWKMPASEIANKSTAAPVGLSQPSHFGGSPVSHRDASTYHDAMLENMNRSNSPMPRPQRQRHLSPKSPTDNRSPYNSDDNL